MPLPLIPALLLGGSVIAGVKGLFDTLSATGHMQTLQRDYDNRRKQYEQNEAIYQQRRNQLDLHLQELYELRLNALVTLGEAVAFLQKARLKERNLFETIKISPEQLAVWEGVSLQAVDVLKGMATSLGAGVGAASAIYGLAGAIGTASTGTAIATLSGAAATNATLAWLGGGALAAGGGGMALGTAVLGGLVAGPALLVTGFFVNSKLEEAKTAVAAQIAQMDVAEAEMWKQIAEFDAMHARIHELQEATKRNQTALSHALAYAHPHKLEDVYTVAKLAKALAELLDINVINHSRSEEAM